MVGETGSGYIPESERSTNTQLIAYGGETILDAGRARAGVAAAFMLDVDRFARRIEGVGIAPAPKGSKRGAGPEVFVATYSSNPHHHLERYTLPAKKHNAAREVSSSLVRGALKRFAQSVGSEQTQFQSRLRVNYDETTAKEKLIEDPNKPTLVHVIDKETKAITTFAICWTQQEAEKALQVWRENQVQGGVGEPIVTNMSLPQRPEVASAEPQPRQARRKLSLPGMQNLRAALGNVGKKRSTN